VRFTCRPLVAKGAHRRNSTENGLSERQLKYSARDDVIDGLIAGPIPMTDMAATAMVGAACVAADCTTKTVRPIERVLAEHDLIRLRSMGHGAAHQRAR
jgi:hypothetical protein